MHVPGEGLCPGPETHQQQLHLSQLRPPHLAQQVWVSTGRMDGQTDRQTGCWKDGGIRAGSSD